MKIKTKFLFLILISFILNLIWEFSHYSLYIDLSGIPSTRHLLIATFTDAFYILIFCIIISLKNRNLSWIDKPKKSDYIHLVILGIITSALIETINLNLGRWEYKLIMPTIFGIGISPLIQLAVTGVFSLIIIKKIRL